MPEPPVQRCLQNLTAKKPDDTDVSTEVQKPDSNYNNINYTDPNYTNPIYPSLDKQEKKRSIKQEKWIG